MRNKLANIYNDYLQSSSLIKVPSIPDLENRSVWAQYTLILDDSIYADRNKIMNLMKEKGIPTALYYPAALHLQKPYLDLDANLPITESIADRVISLPMHPYLNDQEIEYISKNFLRIISGLKS